MHLLSYIKLVIIQYENMKKKSMHMILLGRKVRYTSKHIQRNPLNSDKDTVKLSTSPHHNRYRQLHFC